MDGLSSPVQNRTVSDTAPMLANLQLEERQGMDRGGTPLPWAAGPQAPRSKAAETASRRRRV